MDEYASDVEADIYEVDLKLENKVVYDEDKPFIGFRKQKERIDYG